MANPNTTILDGITFDQSQLGSLASSLALAQSRASGNPFVSTTWTPLGDADSINAGVEQGATRVASLTHSSAIAKLTGGMGMANDSIAVIQNMLQGRLAAAAVEAGGVIGQGVGAGLGGGVGLALAGNLALGPIGTVGLVLVGGTGGAFGGSTAGKSVVIHSLESTPALAPGETVKPIATLPNGVQYGLGLTVEGKVDWYAVLDNSNLAFPSSYAAIPIGLRHQLHDSLAKAMMPAADFAKYDQYVGEIAAQGDIKSNIEARIKPVGSVVIDPGTNLPSSADQVALNLANGRSPDGREALGQQISDGAGKSHYWRVLTDGTVERIAQETYGVSGSRVTISSYAQGSATVSKERQTVAGESGVISDALLTANASGTLVLDKIQLGGVLAEPVSAAAVKPPFSPLPSTGEAGNSYTIVQGDSLWKIGKSMGLSNAETAQFIRDTEADYKAKGLSGNVNDLKPGNTLELPAWVKARTDQQLGQGSGVNEVTVPDADTAALFDDVEAFFQGIQDKEAFSSTISIALTNGDKIEATEFIGGNNSSVYSHADGTVYQRSDTQIHSDGSSILNLYDGSGNNLRGSFERTGGMNGAIGTLTNEVNGKTVSMAYDFSTSTVTGIKTINGQVVGTLGSGTYGLTAEDYTSFGLTFDNLLNGSVGQAGEALIAGMDPAAIQSNNWVPPQISRAILANGFTQTNVVLGNGVTLSTLRDDDRRLEFITDATGLEAIQSYDTNGQSIDLAQLNNLLDTENTLTELHDAGQLSDALYTDFTQWTSDHLVAGGASYALPVQDYSFGLSFYPIGAFYESQSAAYDNAASIARYTGVLVDANKNRISTALLQALDRDFDRQLSTTESASLRLWQDENENGRLDTGELIGVTQIIKERDYDFLTRGNARMRPEALPELQSIQAFQPSKTDRVQAEPSSNYRTLRDTDNVFLVNGGSTTWTSSQIKINYNNQTYLIGTDGNDNFDATSFDNYPQYFNSSLLTRFLGVLATSTSVDEHIRDCTLLNLRRGAAVNDARWKLAA